MNYTEVIQKLESMRNEVNILGMNRFGIRPKNLLGISVKEIRKIARELGKNHELALELWDSKIHEARILASIIAKPKLATEALLDSWVKDFDSWDICDQCCSNVFVKTPYAHQKVFEWVEKEEEFIKRAGFSLIAYIAVHQKKLPNESLIPFLELIKKGSLDERNFVKKAVNWALRQIGKRNLSLNKLALETANEIKGFNSKSAKWIANNAIKELTDEKILARLVDKK